MEISDFTFNSYLYLLIDYNLSIIPVLTLLPWFTNHFHTWRMNHGSSLATWQSKETRLRLLRRGKKFHWSIIQTFQLMNSFEVMIICLLDGCISKKIPTDIKNKGGAIGQPSTSLSSRIQDLQGGG